MATISVPDDQPRARAGIVLGSMYFGTRTPQETAFALLDDFVGLGGRWIDTADNYSFWADPSGVGGQSELLIGDWLRARPGARDWVRLSTKVGQQPLVPHDWPGSAEGLSAGSIRAGVEASLRRLDVDRVDLLWTHAEDRSVPLAEQVEALGGLVADGRVRRLGASNHAGWRVEQARRLALANGWEPYSAIQLRLSYVQPRPGAALPDQGHVVAGPEALDHARAEGLDFWAYTPLLNGGYVRSDRPLPAAYDHPGTTRRLEALAEVAAQAGATPNQVVLAWLLGGDPPVHPIVGVSSRDQLAEAMAAQDLELTAEQRARLDAVA